MLTIQYVWSSPVPEATQFSLPPLTCELPRRRRLRLYLSAPPPTRSTRSIPEGIASRIACTCSTTPNASSGAAPCPSPKMASSFSQTRAKCCAICSATGKIS